MSLIQGRTAGCRPVRGLNPCTVAECTGSFHLPSAPSCPRRAARARARRRPYLVQGDDEEGAPSGALRHHGDEVGVHGAEVIVVDAVGDGHRVVAVLLAGRLAEDVAELGAPVLGVP